MRRLSIVLLGLVMWSCETSDNIGLNVQDNSDLLNSTLIDSFEVVATSVLENTRIETDGVNTVLVGAYTDSKTGTLTAKSYFQIGLADDTEYSFGENLVCDSVILTLEYTVSVSDEATVPHIYGDTTIVQEFDVFELTEAFDSNTTYQSTDELSVNATAVGSTSGFMPKPLTSAATIELSTSYGLSLLTNSEDTTNSEFQDLIFGLALVPRSGSVGSVMGFDLSNANTKIQVYYHDDDGDSLTVDYAISSADRAFNNMSTDFSGTGLAGLMTAGDSVSSASLGNEFYMQSGSGLNVKLRIPELKGILDTLSDFTVNKALLVLPVQPSSTTGILDEPSLSINLFKTDNTNLILEDAEGEVERILGDSESSAGLWFLATSFALDVDEQEYVVDLTTWVQNLAVGDDEYSDILIAPSFNLTRVPRTYFNDFNAVADSSAKPQFKLYITR